MSTAATAPEPAATGGFAERGLAWVARAGNKVPSPAILFLGLIVGVILFSQVLDQLDVGVASHATAVPTDGTLGRSTRERRRAAPQRPAAPSRSGAARR